MKRLCGLAAVLLALVGAVASASASSGPDPIGVPQTPTAPTNPAPPANPSSPEGRCQLSALDQVSDLAGRYRAYKPNAFKFRISFNLKGLGHACAQMGRASVLIFAEHDYDHSNRYTAYSDKDTSSIGSRKQRVAITIRAGRTCWPNPTFGQGDKEHHARERTTAIITWKPVHGHSVSREIDTKTTPGCK